MAEAVELLEVNVQPVEATEVVIDYKVKYEKLLAEFITLQDAVRHACDREWIL